MAECLVPLMMFPETDARAAPIIIIYSGSGRRECFPSHEATEPDRSAAEHVKLCSPPLLSSYYLYSSGTVGF